MSELSTIRNMRDLEQQRNRLLAKAAKEERKVRQDIESIKEDYAPIVRGVNSIRTGFSKLRLITPIVLPVIRFFWNRRHNRKK